MKELVFVTGNKTNQLENLISKGIYTLLVKGIYIKSNCDKDVVIRSHLFEIIGFLFQGKEWYLSDISSLILGFNSQDELFIRLGTTDKKVYLDKFIINILPLDKFYITDVVNTQLNIKRACLELGILQNLVIPKNKGRVMTSTELKEYLKKYNFSLDLDKIDILAQNNNYYGLAKKRFFEIYGVLKGTKPVDEISFGDDLDTEIFEQNMDIVRIKKFEILKKDLLLFSKPETNTPHFEVPTYLENYCFWESYFSNYIEGSKFVPEDAYTLVLNNVQYVRTHDTHNVVNLYQLLKKLYKNKLTEVTTYEEFRELISLLHGQICKNVLSDSGEFKQKRNQNAGGYIYVSPDQLEDTLKKGFELSQSLPTNYLKGLFLHYVLTECHPFSDGNGRLSRVVLNYYLHLDGIHPIIITSKDRTGYLRTLGNMSNYSKSEYYLQFFTYLFEKLRRINFLSADILKSPLYNEIDEDDQPRTMLEVIQSSNSSD